MPSLNSVTNGPGVGDPAQRAEADYVANATPVVPAPGKPIANSPANAGPTLPTEENDYEETP